jgi:putative transposase
MTDKFRDIYRIPSARATWWNYGDDAFYFITICTENRIHYFGEIENDSKIMNKSKSGQIAEYVLNELPNKFSYVKLGPIVVMPNHLHGIIIIDKEKDIKANNNLPKNKSTIGGVTGNNNPMNNDNISTIIRWYKGRCSYEIRKIQNDFAWQARFYDHIIRDEKEYNSISKYIIENPLIWESDKFY